ncbi:hypothetical protein HPB48_011420 [Haemaphysalis longicornis]|uniref:Kelch repeat protein n=1 Tax=Haemaphysalis longicornis TaxID=44386 RepID=A0A9J6GAZ2_HAELO|nr:hypothetical protein HPB48_011420 [Haemaphysalis longicornis]
MQKRATFILKEHRLGAVGAPTFKQDNCANCGGSSPDRWKPRVPHEMLVVVGGLRESYPNEIPFEGLEAFDPCAHRGSPTRTTTLKGGKIYVSGGFDGKKILFSVEVYSPSRDTWSVVHPPLPGQRCSHSMIALGAHIYVIGGYDGRRRLNTVLRRGADTLNRWRMVAPMRMARSAFAIAILDSEIYAIGGYNGTFSLCNNALW